MMQYASQGVRNAARKGSSTIVHHSGHNGPGGSTTANSTSRSLHIPWGAARVAHSPTQINSLESIRPRNPAHKLFSSSKNFLQRFYTHLTSPGLKASGFINQAGSRSLHNPVRGGSIQSTLSLTARQALKSNALQRHANMFLPRTPRPAPARCGGVAQVGLGAARNFSTGRPIFQQLAENVPVVGRAVYEVDWDLEMRKEQARMRIAAHVAVKIVQKSQEMLKPAKSSVQQKVEPALNEELEHYFPTVAVAPVTTYLLIPLAPTPTNRLPLPLDLSSDNSEPALLPALSQLGAVHASYTTHALRVSTLFNRLDQANVWVRGGVQCSAYSQGQSHRRRRNKDGEAPAAEEGVCTILKVEFVGWTKAEVRGVIGESGSGWCVLEEVHNEEDVTEEDGISEFDSLSSSAFDDRHGGFDSPPDFMGPQLIDPAQSFMLPTLDFSSASLKLSRSSSTESIFASLPSEMEDDPWVDEYPYSSSSGSSSVSDLSYTIVDPPTTNGWFGQSHGLGPGVGFGGDVSGEPRESMFY